MVGELTFRKFNEEDLPRISEFRKSYFPYNSLVRCYESEYYRWKCYSNPVQQGEMWLAEDGDMIVGIKNVTPKRMKVLETVVNGAEMGDSFTRPDYQGRGIFTKLSISARESILKNGISLIYNTPNKNSQPAYVQKLNHLPIPIKLRNLMKPLNMKPLSKVKFNISPSLATLLSLAAFLSPIIKIVSDITTRIGAIGGTQSGISISRVSSFPDDIDVFWEQAAKSHDVMLVRSKESLQWRYIENPDNYSIVLATNKEGATVGYVVTKVGFYDSVPAGFLVDFLTLEDNQGIFKKLLLASLKEFHQRRVSVVSTWAVKGRFYDKILLKFGFLPFSRITLMCYQNELGSRVASENHKWHFTMGDSDTI